MREIFHTVWWCPLICLFFFFLSSSLLDNLGSSFLPDPLGTAAQMKGLFVFEYHLEGAVSTCSIITML